uniref:Putative ovule protein n=1 Tax=Solanum chacoense TaxID=4108 RepID=A0A0V0H6E2_SOLCH
MLLNTIKIHQLHIDRSLYPFQSRKESEPMFKLNEISNRIEAATKPIIPKFAYIKKIVKKSKTQIR